MPAPHKEGHEGLRLGHRDTPDLKEMTIELGQSDIYINTAKRVDLEGHTLYEAIMTDPHGSRVIFIDKEEIVDCLKEAFITGHGAEEEKPKP